MKRSKQEQHGLPSSALRISAVHRDIPFIKQLIGHGVPLNQPNDKGYTALHMAVLCGHDEVVRLLLEAGANPNTQEKRNKRTPLFDAVRLGHHDIVAELLNSKANPNIPNIHGDMPIVVAAKDGDIPLVYKLATKKAKVNVVSVEKKGVIAYLKSATDVATRWLKQKGAPDNPPRTTGMAGRHPALSEILSMAAVEHMIGVICQAGMMPLSKKREALAILKSRRRSDR